MFKKSILIFTLLTGCFSSLAQNNAKQAFLVCKFKSKDFANAQEAELTFIYFIEKGKNVFAIISEEGHPIPYLNQGLTISDLFNINAKGDESVEFFENKSFKFHEYDDSIIQGEETFSFKTTHRIKGSYNLVGVAEILTATLELKFDHNGVNKAYLKTPNLNVKAKEVDCSIPSGRGKIKEKRPRVKKPSAKKIRVKKPIATMAIDPWDYESNLWL